MTTAYPIHEFGALLRGAMIERLAREAGLDRARVESIVTERVSPTLSEAADIVHALWGEHLHFCYIEANPPQEKAPEAVQVPESEPDPEPPQPVLQAAPVLQVAPQASALSMEPTAADPLPRAPGRRERVLELLRERPRNRLDLASALDLPVQTVDGILSRASRDGLAHLRDAVWYAGELRHGDWRDGQPWGLVPGVVLSAVTGKVASVISLEHKRRGIKPVEGAARSPEDRWGRLIEAWGAERSRAWVAGCERWREDLEAYLGGGM